MAKEDKPKKHFFKDFKAELKKVIWPTPKQIVNNTIAVVVIVIITAIIVFALDTVFDMANNYGINRLKGSIRNQVSASNDDVENEVVLEDEAAEDVNSVE